MKHKNILYWVLSTVILVGSPEVIFAESTELKVEEDQRKQKRKKKKRVVKKKAATTTVKKNKNTKKKRIKKTKGSSRVKTPISTTPPPNFNNISKTDFISGKHKRLVIPYMDGGKVKWGVGRYKSGRYIIVRDIGINADGTTYDYWKSK
jgi:hypothetical protein